MKRVVLLFSVVGGGGAEVLLAKGFGLVSLRCLAGPFLPSSVAGTLSSSLPDVRLVTQARSPSCERPRFGSAFRLRGRSAGCNALAFSSARCQYGGEGVKASVCGWRLRLRLRAGLNPVRTLVMFRTVGSTFSNPAILFLSFFWPSLSFPSSPSLLFFLLLLLRRRLPGVCLCVVGQIPGAEVWRRFVAPTIRAGFAEESACCQLSLPSLLGK